MPRAIQIASMVRVMFSSENVVSHHSYKMHKDHQKVETKFFVPERPDPTISQSNSGRNLVIRTT